MNTPNMPHDTTIAIMTTKFVNHFCRRDLSDGEVVFIYRLLEQASRDRDTFERMLEQTLGINSSESVKALIDRQGQGIEGDMRVTIPSSRRRLKTR